MRRDRVNDREEEEKKAAESGGDERTLRRQESLSKMFLIGLQRCVITKMTADDNSGQLMDSPPICCSRDRNEIYQANVKIYRTVFIMHTCMQQMYRQMD